MEEVNRFLEAKEENDWNAHERLRTALGGMVTEVDDLSESRSSLLSLILSMALPYLAILNLFVLLPAAVLLLHFLVRTRSLLLISFLCIFAFSLYSTYDRRYQEAVAARLEASTSLRDACEPPTFLESTVESITGMMFIRKKSKCRQWIESQTVPIVSQIPITEVLSEVVFSGFLSFLSHLGTHLNRFFLNLYADLPIPIAVVVSVMVCFTFLFSLFFLSGYRITAPFFAFEPHAPSTLAQLAHTLTTAHSLPPPPSSSQSLAHSPSAPAAIESADRRRPPKADLPSTSENYVPGDWQQRHEEERRAANLVTPRTPQRRSRMEERRAQEERRSISLPRKGLP